LPGKYSHLKNSLTRIQGEPEYQERVSAERERIKKFLVETGEVLTATNFGLILVKARQEKDRLEALIKDENLMIAAMDQELVELLESQDWTGVKLGNGISLSIKDDVYVKVADKESFHKWVEENDPDLFTVNYQTMSSLVKNKLVDGEEIPPGVEPYFKQSITVRGGKNVLIDNEE
jgi:hypothetical protein